MGQNHAECELQFPYLILFIVSLNNKWVRSWDPESRSNLTREFLRAYALHGKSSQKGVNISMEKLAASSSRETLSSIISIFSWRKFDLMWKCALSYHLAIIITSVQFAFPCGYVSGSVITSCVVRFQIGSLRRGGVKNNNWRFDLVSLRPEIPLREINEGVKIIIIESPWIFRQLYRWYVTVLLSLLVSVIIIYNL